MSNDDSAGDIQSVDLPAVSTAIASTLAGLFPAFVSVQAMPDQSEIMDLPVPAVFIDLEQVEPAPDPGTGQSAVRCRFCAYLLIGPECQGHTRLLGSMVTAMIAALREQCWGIPAEPAEFVEAMPDGSRPELDNLVVWSVRWDQVIYLGAASWDWVDSTGLTLLVGISPEVGPEYVKDYFDPKERLDELSTGRT